MSDFAWRFLLLFFWKQIGEIPRWNSKIAFEWFGPGRFSMPSKRRRNDHVKQVDSFNLILRPLHSLITQKEKENWKRRCIFLMLSEEL